MHELPLILSSMKMDLPEIVFGDTLRNPIYASLKTFCENSGDEQVLDTRILRKYLLMAGTAKALEYLSMIEEANDATRTT
jgi:hypothetical protein